MSSLHKIYMSETSVSSLLKAPMPKRKRKTTKKQKKVEISSQSESEEQTSSQNDGRRENSKMQLSRMDWDEGVCESDQKPRAKKTPNNKIVHPSSGTNDRCLCNDCCFFNPIPNLAFDTTNIGGRVIVCHLLAACFTFIVIFPFINLFWTYIVSAESEVETLLQFITDEPTSENGFVHHFNQFKWVRFPFVRVEVFTLLVATGLTNYLTASWFQRQEDMNLTNIVKKQVLNKYR